MKKPKLVKPFVFKDLSHQEMVDLLNTTAPIDLRHNESLVDRVHQKYQFLTKTQISIIIKAVFQVWRDLLLLGKVLNFNNLFFDTKLHFFDYRRDGHILPSLKVKISTPPPLRDYER